MRHDGNKGGTAIILPYTSIEKRDNETRDDALRRIRSTRAQLPQGRGIAVNAYIDGHKLTLASVYAPAQPAERPAFFTNILPPLINKNTILGIDANCVPDETLDLHRPHAATPYNNAGANELADLTTRLELIDVARECLGEEKFFTSHHNVAGGSVTSTRIDRILVPNIDGLMWDHVPNTHDFFCRDPRAKELDHEPAQVATTSAAGIRGNDLQHINESVYDNPTFNARIRQMINTTVNLAAPGATKGETWNEIKRQAKDMSIAETIRILASTQNEERGNANDTEEASKP